MWQDASLTRSDKATPWNESLDILCRLSLSLILRSLIHVILSYSSEEVASLTQRLTTNSFHLIIEKNAMSKGKQVNSLYLPLPFLPLISLKIMRTTVHIILYFKTIFTIHSQRYYLKQRCKNGIMIRLLQGLDCWLRCPVGNTFTVMVVCSYHLEHCQKPFAGTPKKLM